MVRLSGILTMGFRLYVNELHPDTRNTSAASDSTADASLMTYCQDVLWINPLLTAIEKANNQLAGIREIEKSRATP